MINCHRTKYFTTLQMMQKMFKECNLIHADLSEYNMLWHEEKLWFIDVSQSVEPTHPRALEFLVRDCSNVVTFFEKAGVPCVMSVEKLFKHVSGMEVSGEKEDFLNQVGFILLCCQGAPGGTRGILGSKCPPLFLIVGFCCW